MCIGKRIYLEVEKKKGFGCGKLELLLSQRKTCELLVREERISTRNGKQNKNREKNIIGHFGGHHHHPKRLWSLVDEQRSLH